MSRRLHKAAKFIRDVLFFLQLRHTLKTAIEKARYTI